MIGLVPQTAYLFTGTVASNLRYGRPDATDDELWEALRIAAGRGLRGRAAGGPRRRRSRRAARTSRAASGSGWPSPARSCAQPEVYLFDDSFSALDLATDARLRAALRPLTRDATVVVVAQRVSTIVDADQIVVLDDGAVVGLGTHDELLDRLPDLRRDRRVAAAGGGGGVSTPRTARRRRRDRQALAARPTRGPGRDAGQRRHAGREVDGLLAVGHAGCCGGSGPDRRRVAWSGAHRRPASSCAVVGPRILGQATDLIFAGVIGQQLPPGITQDQADGRGPGTRRRRPRRPAVRA